MTIPKLKYVLTPLSPLYNVEYTSFITTTAMISRRISTLLILILYLVSTSLGIESTDPAFPAIAPQLSASTNLRTEIVNNNTHHDFPSETLSRGTITILYSSIFLLFVSCYTFIRLNIPGPSNTEENYFSFYLRKLKWVFITLLFPEVAVHEAILQRWETGRLLKRLNKRWEIDTEKGMEETKERFTVRQAWYVMMGGLVVDFGGVVSRQELERWGIPKGKVTLRPEAVMMLYEVDSGIGIIPDDMEIKDKDKESVILNILVYLQTIFLIASKVLRMNQGYARSVLEIRCLTQITYMLILFTFWGSKPMDILTPTLITNSQALKIYQHISSSSNTHNKFLFTHRAYNLTLNQPSSDPKTNPRNYIFWLEHVGLFLSFGIFGLFNTAANNIPFPTPVENLLWKFACSSTIVGSTIPVFLRMGFSQHFGNEHGDVVAGVTEESPVKIMGKIVRGMRGRCRCVMILMGLMAAWAIVSRILLLVLPFLALREMVVGTFTLVKGPEFVPHFA